MLHLLILKCSPLSLSFFCPIICTVQHSNATPSITHRSNLTTVCPVVGKTYPSLQLALYITTHHTNILQNQQTCLPLLTMSTYISGQFFLASFLILHVSIFEQDSNYMDGANCFSIFIHKFFFLIFS